MAAQQRDDGAAVLSEGQDRRFGTLVRQDGTNGTDQDAGGADADDRRSGLEQGAQVVQRCGELAVRAADAMGKAVDLGAGQNGARTFGHFKAALREDDEDGSGHDQASPRLWTSTMEKYGTLSGSTSSSGSRRWFGIVARST